MDVIFGKKIVIRNNRNVNNVTINDIDKSINIVFPNVDIKQLYLLVIYNMKGPYINYMMANIPGCNIDRGKIVYDYIKPTLSEKYVISIYRQRYEVNIESYSRNKFPLKEFVKEGNLQLESIAFF